MNLPVIVLALTLTTTTTPPIPPPQPPPCHIQLDSIKRQCLSALATYDSALKACEVRHTQLLRKLAERKPTPCPRCPKPKTYLSELIASTAIGAAIATALTVFLIVK